MDSESNEMEAFEELRATDTMEVARKFVHLAAEKKRLKAQLLEVQKSIDKLDEQLCERFLELGTQKVTVDGATVYLQRGTRVKLIVPDGADPIHFKQLAVRKLEELGHAAMIGWNHRSLQSLVVASLDETDELPSPLGDIFSTEPEFHVRATGVSAGAGLPSD